MAFSADDPVATGLVASLAPPGGNITGLTIRAPELAAKRLELLQETLPQVSRVAVLWDVLSAEQLREVEMAARTLNVELQPLELRYPPYDYEHALSAAVQGRAEALFVLMPQFFLASGPASTSLSCNIAGPPPSACGNLSRAAASCPIG
jgi:putative tryptophan/tyrosine transport system substrate-binding protein